VLCAPCGHKSGLGASRWNGTVSSWPPIPYCPLEPQKLDKVSATRKKCQWWRGRRAPHHVSFTGCQQHRWAMGRQLSSERQVGFPPRSARRAFVTVSGLVLPAAVSPGDSSSDVAAKA
jgi:hypothetical protein